MGAPSLEAGRQEKATRKMDKFVGAAIGAALVVLASPALGGWTVQRNEPDPFGPKGSAEFAAGEGNSSMALWIRCLQGKISLELVVEAFGVSEGDRANVKLIADSKDILEDNNAQVVETSSAFTGIQFGDEDTLNYLKGTQKLSVRAGVRGSSETVSFAGGKSMDGVIDKARKVCGMSPPSEPGALAEPQASTPGKDCSGIPMENRTLDCAPSAQPISTTAQPGSAEWARASNACLRPNNFVADENDKWTCVKE
jgi:hypothetical protein